MKKGKPKLKTGTRQYGKPASAVSLAPCPWDMGAETLAAKTGGRVKDFTVRFQKWLRANPVKPIKVKEKIEDKETGKFREVERDETERERLKRAAAIFVAREIDGVFDRTEQATDVTPDGETPNPNNVTRKRRIDVLEIWHGRWKRQQRVPNTDQLMPYITTRQFNAAVLFRDAFEATQRAPGWPDNDRVQSSPKPDHAVTIQIDRIARYHAIARHMRAQDWPIIRLCVIEGNEPVTTAGYPTLREALDWIADGLEGRKR